MVVAGVRLIEIRNKFNTLTDNEEENNDDQDPGHVSFLAVVLCGSGEGLGGVPGGEDQGGVEDGDDDVGTELNKHQLHPEHVDCYVGRILNEDQVNFILKDDINNILS